MRTLVMPEAAQLALDDSAAELRSQAAMQC